MLHVGLEDVRHQPADFGQRARVGVFALALQQRPDALSDPLHPALHLPQHLQPGDLRRPLIPHSRQMLGQLRKQSADPLRLRPLRLEPLLFRGDQALDLVDPRPDFALPPDPLLQFRQDRRVTRFQLLLLTRQRLPVAAEAENLVMHLRRAAHQLDDPGLLILQRRLRLRQAAGERLILGQQPVDAGMKRVRLLLKAGAFRVLPLQFAPRRGQPRLVCRKTVIQPTQQPALLLDALRRSRLPLLLRRHPRLRADQFVLRRGHPCRQGVQLRGQRRLLGLPLGDLGAQSRNAVGQGVRLGALPRHVLRQTVIIRQRPLGAQLTQTLVVLLKVPRLARRQLHAPQTLLQLVHHVRDAEQVLLRPLETALRLLAARLVPADPRRLLENHPPLARTAAQQHVHLPLLDHGVRLRPDPRVEEDLPNVLQPRRLIVDQVLAFAGSVELARDRYLRRVQRQLAVRVVEDQVDPRHPAALARR